MVKKRVEGEEDVQGYTPREFRRKRDLVLPTRERERDIGLKYERMLKRLKERGISREFTSKRESLYY